MILNNYYEWVKFCNTTTFTYSTVSKATNVKNLNGDNLRLNYGGNASYLVNAYANNLALGAGIFITVGSSDAEGTVYDYDLKSRISSGVTISSVSLSVGADGKTSRIYNFVITNNGSEDITIREVGIGKSFYINATETQNTAILCRVVFDEDVTIALGASTTIAVKWDEE